MICIRVSPGEEVITVMQRYADKNSIRNAAVVSVIGAVDSCCLSNMPVDDAKKDILETIGVPLEISGCGEIIDGKPHLHISASSVNNDVYCGHLHWAQVDTWYVHLYVMPFDK